MQWTSLFGTACLIPFLLACGDKDRPPIYKGNPNVPTERLPESTEAFTELSCPVSVTGFVTQCGTVTVPEGPGSERTIELFVARVFSRAESVKPEPVVYLDGGPGAGSISSLENLYLALGRVALDRDFIFLDQRGTGRSDPALHCRGQQAGESLGEALDRCFETLSSDSNLSNYNTVENARDVDAVREAFGYQQLNLYGISYGTRLALTVMRDYPEGVRSAILDAVVPLEVDLLGEVGINGYQAFLEAFSACEEDSDCHQKYPDPLGQLISIVERLNEEPVELEIGELYGDTVTEVVFSALYSPYTLVYVPQMIDNLAKEDYSLFEQVGEAVADEGIAFGMHLSLHCAEEIPFSDAASVEALDEQIPDALRVGLSGARYLDWCQHWPVDKAPERENEPVVSTVPALVMAGRFDPITPPKYSELVHDSLGDSQYFLLEGDSHGASTGECGTEVVKNFLRQPEGDAAAGCVLQKPDLDFQSRLRRPRAHVVEADLKMETTPPSDEEWQRALSDLRRRLRSRGSTKAER